MIKSVALVIVLVLGIATTVFIVQKSTLMQSFGYEVSDFSNFFHSSVQDSEFNTSMDVYQDGIINVMDVLKDRYSQAATSAGEEVDPDDLLNIMDSSEATDTSTPEN